MSGDVQPSNRAAQLLSDLAARVGGVAPPVEWLAALEATQPLVLECVHRSAARRSTGCAAAKDRDRPIGREGVEASASAVARHDGRSTMLVTDVARAVVALVLSPDDEVARAARAVAIPDRPAESPREVSAESPPVRADGNRGEAGEDDTTERTPAEPSTFRVFVSSTFADFAVERDALRARVWPRLRAFCAEFGARFQEVDLRWGITEEAAVDQQSLAICLEEVARCRDVSPRPSFLVLVGQRYGWTPPPSAIPAEEWNAIVTDVATDDAALLREWYVLDRNGAPPEHVLRPRTGAYLDPSTWAETEARLQRVLAAVVADLGLPAERQRAYTASATEQEIWLGALSDDDSADRAVCVVRTIESESRSSVGEVTSSAVYADVDEVPTRRLRSLLAARLGEERLLRFAVASGPNGPEFSTAYVDEFCDRVYESLRAIISAEIAAPTLRSRPGDDDPALDTEGRAHRRFATVRSRDVVGREQERRLALAYVSGSSRDALLVTGGGGTGKSALLAKVAADVRAHHPHAVVVERYVGATPSSTDGLLLLAGICGEIDRRRDERGVVGSGYVAVARALSDRLRSATSDRPLVLVVDGLDGLPDGTPAASLSWLPSELPAHARLLVSARGGRVSEVLRGRSEELNLLPLSREDGARLLTRRLEEYGRTLQPDQTRAVLDGFEASQGNPLYLSLAIEEARRWPSTLRATQSPVTRAPTGPIWWALSERFTGTGHGPIMTSRALGYLAATRNGLTEDELVELLDRDPDVIAEFIERSFRLPPEILRLDGDGCLEVIRHDPSRRPELDHWVSAHVVTPNVRVLPGVLWARLLHDLEPLLDRRRSDEVDVLLFHHAEIAKGAVERHVLPVARKLHSLLADCFAHRGGVREVAEVPYHLARAGRWFDLLDLLTDLEFVRRAAVLAPLHPTDGGDGGFLGIYRLRASVDDALGLLPGPPSEDEIP